MLYLYPYYPFALTCICFIYALFDLATEFKFFTFITLMYFLLKLFIENMKIIISC